MTQRQTGACCQPTRADAGADEVVVVSGATGFVGRELVRELLARLPAARLALLVRDTPDQPAERRFERILRSLPPSEREAVRTRIEVLPADVTAPQCGMVDETYRRIAQAATRVIHAAADIRFDQTLPEARQVNVEGTRHVLELASQSRRLRSFVYVGTAFVAGRRSGCVREDELQAEWGFRNNYERTKFEAEQMVRTHMDRLPTVILRPSVIVGDSHTGITTSFKTIYWPLKVYAKGLWRLVPGDPNAVVDMVPVDFVAAATACLALDERAIGRCVHLCAGPARSAPIGELAAATSRFLGVPAARFINPTLFVALLRPVFYALVSKQRRDVLRKGAFYRPYLSMRLAFDTTNAHELLAPAGLAPPHVQAYWENLLRYCVESDWGRRAVQGLSRSRREEDFALPPKGNC